jgi:hypothetical protein
MKTFKDSAGRKWKIDLSDATALERVHSTLGIDLAAANDPAQHGDGSNVYETLAQDVPLLVNMIYCLCKPQADALGMTDYDFCLALKDENGDAIEKAVDAILRESVSLVKGRQYKKVLKAELKKIGVK